MKFASIPVTDQDRALAFYTNKLGFRIATDQPYDAKQRWIELSIAGSETGIVLFRTEAGPEPGKFMGISFWSDDVEGTAKDMKARGVEFVQDPERQDWGTSAIFKDPDGNTFVLSSR